MTESEIREILDELLETGIIRPTESYRDGQPVYELVPEAELTETAEALLNAMCKGRPS